MLLSMPLVANTFGRIRAEANMRGEQQRLTREVQRLERCQSQLDSAVAYAHTDAFVEQWARERERLGRAGDIAIVTASSQPKLQPARPWWEGLVDCGDPASAPVAP